MSTSSNQFDNLPRPRLLFVDDDLRALSALARFMRRYRFDVATALSCQEGLQLLQKQGPFQVVICDYRMAGMVDEQFLAQVAQLSPATRRVVLSGYADSAQLLAAINSGQVHRYLTKPWNFHELLTVMHEMLDEYLLAELQLGQLQQLVDANQQLALAIRAHASELEAQGRQLQESGHRQQLLAAHLEKVRDEERRAVASDIHDDLGQTLTAMNLQLAALLRSDTAVDLKPGLQELKQQVDVAIGTVQRIISTIRPQVLEELGLETALEGLAQELRKRGGVRCVVSCGLAGEPLAPQVVTCLYRVAQESITNIMRHAGADKVLLTIRRSGGWCHLQIRDNGVGIDEARAAAADAFGLMGMRERVARCGGSFSISPRSGGGTIVEVLLPEHSEEAIR